MLLSICIPTFNRPEHLPNCLNSIYLASAKSKLKFEVCISDNCSNYNVKKIISKFKKKLNIKLNINRKNLGYVPNLMKAISISKGEFVWAIGDDDLLVPNSLKKICKLLNSNKDTDFFFINSFHLNNDYLANFPKPFHTKHLPKNMKKLSKKKGNYKMMFWDLIDYKVSFDFLIGNFLNIFRRKMWLKNLSCLNKKKLSDTRQWSNFDNTCGPLKVYANAFKNSKAYFTSDALTVNSYGVREWHLMYPYIEIVMLPQALDYYRSRGLNFFSYVINKNYALRNFMNYFVKIIILGDKGGLKYVNFYQHFFKNLIYPNAFLSIFYFILRKFKKIF